MAGSGGSTFSHGFVSASADSFLRPKTIRHAARLVELDDHVGSLVDRPDVVVLVDAHAVRERPAVESLSDLADELALRPELEQLRRRRRERWTARAVRSREDEDVSFRVDRHAGDFAEVHAGRQLEEVGARLEWNVGNALLRDRRRRDEQEQCKYRRFHRVLRAADAIAEQANGIDCGRIREEPHMTGDRSFRILLALGLLSAAVAVSCTSPSSTTSSAPAAAAPAVAQEKGGQEEFGPYEVVPNWPQPLPDGPDGVKHDGWTWGSVGAVYAETPDRIWIAQRGELPLPAGREAVDAVRHAAADARQRDRQ